MSPSVSTPEPSLDLASYFAPSSVSVTNLDYFRDSTAEYVEYLLKMSEELFSETFPHGRVILIESEAKLSCTDHTEFSPEYADYLKHIHLGRVFVGGAYRTDFTLPAWLLFPLNDEESIELALPDFIQLLDLEVLRRISEFSKVMDAHTAKILQEKVRNLAAYSSDLKRIDEENQDQIPSITIVPVSPDHTRIFSIRQEETPDVQLPLDLAA